MGEFLTDYELVWKRVIEKAKPGNKILYSIGGLEKES